VGLDQRAGALLGVLVVEALLQLPALGRRVTTGASTTTPTSKDTGKPKIKPVRPDASGACIAPNNRSNRSAIV
jgi:hypothetical protein